MLLDKDVGIRDHMKNRQRCRRQYKRSLPSRVDCRQAKRSSRWRWDCYCGRVGVGRVQCKAKTCSETQEKSLREKIEFYLPAQTVVAVASLCLSLTIAVVLAKGNPAKFHHL